MYTLYTYIRMYTIRPTENFDTTSVVCTWVWRVTAEWTRWGDMQGSACCYHRMSWRSADRVPCISYRTLVHLLYTHVAEYHRFSQNCEKRLLALSCLVYPSPWSNSAPTGRIFMDFSIFRKSPWKIQRSLQSDKNNGYFTWKCMYAYMLLNFS